MFKSDGRIGRSIEDKKKRHCESIDYIYVKARLDYRGKLVFIELSSAGIGVAALTKQRDSRPSNFKLTWR